MITGMIAGLAAVTPASGFVTPMGAICIGIGAGVIPWLTVTYVKALLGYDDSLDAFGVHGVGGIWGVIATGLFATKAVNPAGADGLFYGNPGLLWIQIEGRGHHDRVLVRGRLRAAQGGGRVREGAGRRA